MQYYALPEAKRNNVLVSAFEEVLNKIKRCYQLSKLCHRGIIGRIDAYRNLAGNQERNEFIKQYIHFYSQGRMAKSEQLFAYSGGFFEGVGEGLEK